MIYLSDEREEPTTKITLPGKDLIQILWRNQNLYRQTKAKRIQHHQTSSTTNAIGTSLSGKHKRRKGRKKNKPKTIKKMVIGTYISKITLNVNGLNAPTKRHSLAEQIQNKTHIYAVYKRPTSDLGHIQTESEGMEKDIPCKRKSKKAGVAILISD